MAEFKLKPLGDRIIVQPQKESVTKGGLVLPDTVEEKPQVGKVIAVGEGKRDDSGKLVPISLKKDDLVLFPKYSPTEFVYEDEEYLVMSESDVLAVIK